MRILAIALLVLAPGCSVLIDSSRYVGGSDGGPERDAGDGGPSFGCEGVVVPPNTIVGFHALRFLSATAEELVLGDFTGTTIQAYVRDTNEPSGFLVFEGTDTAEGTFRIEGVPDGATYYLKLVSPGGSTVFAEHDARCLDLSSYAGGRSDATTVSLTQPIELHVDSMQPWSNADWLIAEVYNTMTEEWAFNEVLSIPLVRGATTVDATFDWGCPFNCYSWRPDGRPALIEASRGDVLQLAHARLDAALDTNGRVQESVSTLDVVDVAGVEMPPGGTTRVDATFVPVAQDQTVRFLFNRAMFDAGYPDGQTRYLVTNLSIFASPAVDRGFYVGIPIAGVNLVDWSHGHPLQSTLDVQYGDPVPAEWPRVYYRRYSRSRRFLFPGAPNFRPQSIHMDSVGPVVMPVPDRPAALPPANIRVGGQASAEGGRVSFDGASPLTVAWNGVSQANLYRITVTRVFRDGNETGFAQAAVLRTRETSIDIPPEVFSGGEYFFFIVAAVRDGGNYAAGTLNLQAYPSSSSAAITGLFRLSSTCGDGDVDTGEECDPGATATAACDIDCTAPECGDGIRNAVAGEACDAGGHMNTSGCDQDCSLPVCGDGIWNPDTEDCDDGNTTSDGNGCGPDCRADNVCGDNIVQDQWEHCDDGNTIDDGNGCNAGCRGNNVCGDGIVDDAIEACDSSGADTAACNGALCTAPTCGDEYVNAAAAEECDPPDGATCSPLCTVL